jgi:hypothetical protein
MMLLPQEKSRDIYVKRKQKESVKCVLDDATHTHVLSSSGEIKQIVVLLTSVLSFFF